MGPCNFLPAASTRSAYHLLVRLFGLMVGITWTRMILILIYSILHNSVDWEYKKLQYTP